MKYYSVLFLLGLFFQFASDIQGRILLLCQNMSCVLVRIHVKSVYCLCVCIFVVHGCMSLCAFGECAGFFFAQGSSYCFQEGILYTVIKAVQPMLWIII